MEITFKNKKNKFKHKDYYQAFVRKFFAKIAEKVFGEEWTKNSVKKKKGSK